MSQISITDRQVQLKRRSGAERGLWSAASDLGLHAGIVILVLTGLLLLYEFRYPLHHDLAGSVLSGRLAVTLGDAFRDYSIYFPPAEKFWFSLAARLSDLTGLRLDLVIVVMTGAMVLVGAGLAYRIRRETVGASPLFFVLSVAVLLIVPVLFKNVFGLREHLVAAGLWPYLVFRVSDPDGTRIGWQLRVFLGLWMGATLLFKYLYSIVVFLVELADAAMRRRALLLFRIENIIAGAVVFLYLFLWLGLDPAQREAISAMLSAIEANLDDRAENWSNAIENLLYVIPAFVLLRIFRVPPRLMALGLATVVGAVLVAWSQERWYTHHLFPIAMAYIAWWWMAARDFRWWGHAAVALLLILSIGTQYSKMRKYHEGLAELEQAIDEGGLSVAGKRIAILNMHPSPYNEYLASNGGLRWTPMMNNAYVSAELKPFDKKENAGKPSPPVKLDDPGRRVLHEQMLRLWEDMPPDVLILDRTDSWPLKHIDVDWTHVFSEDSQFSAIFDNYRPVLVHDGARISFTYYVRAD